VVFTVKNCWIVEVIDSNYNEIRRAPTSHGSMKAKEPARWQALSTLVPELFCSEEPKEWRECEQKTRNDQNDRDGEGFAQVAVLVFQSKVKQEPADQPDDDAHTGLA